jgi:hypothetical protein
VRRRSPPDMRTPVKVSVFSLAALLVAAVGVTATPADPPGLMIDAEWLMEDCTQLTPAAASVHGVTHDGEVAPLEVLALLDVAEGADIERKLQDPDLSDEEREARRTELLGPLVEQATRDLAPGTKSYDEIAVDLRYSSIDLLYRVDAAGNGLPRPDHPEHIMARAKAQYGGARPDGFDLVYVLTDLDLRLPPPINNNVIGMADCIGGIRYPDRAFGVGQWGMDLIPDGGFQFGPVTLYKDFTAKVAAHELGHLLGGHHHYQGCGDGGVKGLANNSEPGPCTLMTNSLDFQAYPFSVLNGAVVRGHVLEYAGDHDH